MYLGIEIGGTKLQFGVGTGLSADLREVVRMDIHKRSGASGILGQIDGVVRDLKTKYGLDGIGIGFGGPVDMQSGTVIKSHQIAGWDDFELAAWSERELGLPARIGNDCDVAALAEAKFGAGRGKRIVFYVTAGTGVGGGLVVDNDLFARQRTARAEIGHLRPGLDCLGANETVESIASGPGIVLQILNQGMTGYETERLLLDASGENSLPDGGADIEGLLELISARDIAVAAGVGNPNALRALDRAAQVLGWAIAQAITLTSAEIVVVGGGVSLAGDTLFLDPVRKYAANYVFPPLKNTFEIVSAALGEEVVVHGALLLAAAN